MSDSNFVMPDGVVKDADTATPQYARYEVAPFENGYAQTVGIALRRVLLSSIEGVAVTAVRIGGADHEFTTVPGIAEDVTDIIIAIKQVLVKSAPVIPESIAIHKKGPCVVTAGDFEAENAVTIVNPALPIATVSAGASFDLEAKLAVGYGFHLAEWNSPKDQVIGLIPVDSIHSPVSRVNFSAEAYRVGNMTDYEKLVLEIWTDGRITPDDALKAGAELIRRHFDVFLGVTQSTIQVQIQGAPEEPAAPAAPAVAKPAATGAPVQGLDRLRSVLAMNISELELSVRSSNCLNREKITTVGELATKTEEEMLNFRSFGQKSLDEIREKFAQLGIGDPRSLPEELLEPYRKK